MGEPPRRATEWADESPRTDAGIEASSSTIGLHRVRRLCLGVLTALVALALSSTWWPSATQRVEEQGMRLQVRHEHHLRPGIDGSLTLDVVRDAGGELSLQVPRDLLVTLGATDVRPAPDAEREQDGDVLLTWSDAPPRQIVSVEGRVPTRQAPGRHRWEVTAYSGDSRAAVSTTVWVLP